MRIGIYGSSFNPPTNGHLWSANTIAQREELDKVILLPSSSKRTDKNIKVADLHRMEMLRLAVADSNIFEIDDHEMKAISGKQYSYVTMEYFREKYPDDELFFLMGADLLAELPNWTYGEKFIQSTKFIVIERQNIPMGEIIAKTPMLRKYHRNFSLIYKGIVNEISSSYIREEFESGADPRYLLPEAVYWYIKSNNVYLTSEPL
ncbi:Nicotinate-nucleotide adenylyltransferase [Sporomusa silvacetica DSM 10669]|uniref:Probable nicotinate-nucleotide adenylyltransferase n=1 Tax=Sporomusa silvacetica DSM 10669 TaxID=1123289 RepID=A0ABZ3IJ39_9FIRM|nr:nicotinate (nicotinamide) nucleotide adenylyltransferase [Sporomusa silvacetica]OZC22247.1 nicotinate-nucleotide adenylyltransferase [Sporomusa silvacetica DSM 10669]